MSEVDQILDAVAKELEIDDGIHEEWKKTLHKNLIRKAVLIPKVKEKHWEAWGIPFGASALIVELAQAKSEESKKATTEISKPVPTPAAQTSKTTVKPSPVESKPIAKIENKPTTTVSEKSKPASSTSMSTLSTQKSAAQKEKKPDISKRKREEKEESESEKESESSGEENEKAPAQKQPVAVTTTTKQPKQPTAIVQKPTLGGGGANVATTAPLPQATKPAISETKPKSVFKDTIEVSTDKAMFNASLFTPITPHPEDEVAIWMQQHERLFKPPPVPTISFCEFPRHQYGLYEIFIGKDHSDPMSVIERESIAAFVGKKPAASASASAAPTREIRKSEPGIPQAAKIPGLPLTFLLPNLENFEISEHDPSDRATRYVAQGSWEHPQRVVNKGGEKEIDLSGEDSDVGEETTQKIEVFPVLKYLAPKKKVVAKEKEPEPQEVEEDSQESEQEKSPASDATTTKKLRVVKSHKRKSKKQKEMEMELERKKKEFLEQQQQQEGESSQDSSEEEKRSSSDESDTSSHKKRHKKKKIWKESDLVGTFHLELETVKQNHKQKHSKYEHVVTV